MDKENLKYYVGGHPDIIKQIEEGTITDVVKLCARDPEVIKFVEADLDSGLSDDIEKSDETEASEASDTTNESDEGIDVAPDAI